MSLGPGTPCPSPPLGVTLASLAAGFPFLSPLSVLLILEPSVNETIVRGPLCKASFMLHKVFDQNEIQGNTCCMQKGQVTVA